MSVKLRLKLDGRWRRYAVKASQTLDFDPVKHSSAKSSVNPNALELSVGAPMHRSSPRTGIG
jgi:hypothetical protein